MIQDCFSLRRYQPNQVRRDCLNSMQNTPKANANIQDSAHMSGLLHKKRGCMQQPPENMMFNINLPDGTGNGNW